jgi:hypothetical protein
MTLNNSTSRSEAAVGPQETFKAVEAPITPQDRQRATGGRYDTEPSGRLDTIVSQIEVTGNDGTSHRTFAAHYVAKWPECARVLGVWSAQMRGPSGHIVWNVEWEEEYAQDEDS